VPCSLCCIHLDVPCSFCSSIFQNETTCKPSLLCCWMFIVHDIIIIIIIIISGWNYFKGI
jgi:hypothetical protein